MQDEFGPAGDEPLDFLIVVPVLNEAAALPALLAELRVLGLLERTLFVDNGSSDGGPELILAAGGESLREPRKGYGYPCLRGAHEARARGAFAVVFMEADGTDDPAQVRHLVGPVLAGAADLVLGSRRQAVLGRSAGRMPLHQRLGNAWLGFSLRQFFGMRLSDDSPFRAVRMGLLDALTLEERAYAFPTEMAVKAWLNGARVVSREVRYRRRSGASKIAGSWRASFGAVRDITWCLVRLRIGALLRGL
jgi:glycosyltransferase involved in cell wall biosynthesis